MFGGHEILVIVIGVVILFFGGRKIPEIARGLGKGMNEFKQGMRGQGDETSSDAEDENTNAEKRSDTKTGQDNDKKGEDS